MNNKKATGKLSKVLKLISVLEKCNGKASIGSSEALISPKAAKIMAAVGLVFLTGALAVTAYFVEPFIAPYIALQDFAKSLMMILLLLTLVLSIKNIVTVLYTADDLPVLLPMPFSAGQIVTAKLVVSLKFPVILSLVLVNSTLLGLGFNAGMGATYIIGTVLSSVLIPVTGLAVAALIIVVVFRLFGFIRNRDVTLVLGGVFTLALTLAYVFASNTLRGDSGSAAIGILSSVASLSNGFPNVSFMSSFMFDGNVLGLLISLAVTAAVILLALVVIKLFYMYSALSMQNTGKSNKAVGKGDLDGIKQTSALKALTSYEAKNARRNPAYLIYGFAMTFIWPVLFVLPMILGKGSFFSIVKYSPDTGALLTCALLLGITASCFACGFNILPVTAFSREGDSFNMLRSMPIVFGDYYRSKRNFSMLICSLGSVAYIIILGIVCTATGIVSAANCWVFLFGALVSYLCNSIIINCMLMNNAKKPVFNWDSETELSRKLGWINIVAIVIGFVAYLALFAAIIASSAIDISAVMLNGISITLIGAIGSAAIAFVILAVAAAVNKISVKKAEKSLF